MPVASCIYLMNAPTKWEHEELKLFGYVNIFDNLWSCLVLFRKRIMEFFTLVYCFVQHSVVAPIATLREPQWLFWKLRQQGYPLCWRSRRSDS